nr:hypothetical protein [uncultured Psychroserpens sp.]
MRQKLSAIFFLIIFTALISAPSVVMAIDSSIDISCLYTMNEEEEEKGHQGSKGGKIFCQESMSLLDYINGMEKAKQTAYFFKTYPKPHLNLISPPPEFIS